MIPTANILGKANTTDRAEKVKNEFRVGRVSKESTGGV